MTRIGFHHSHFDHFKINSKAVKMTEVESLTSEALSMDSQMYTEHAMSDHFNVSLLQVKARPLKQHLTDIAQKVKIVRPALDSNRPSSQEPSRPC